MKRKILALILGLGALLALPTAASAHPLIQSDASNGFQLTWISNYLYESTFGGQIEAPAPSGHS